MEARGALGKIAGASGEVLVAVLPDDVDAIVGQYAVPHAAARPHMASPQARQVRGK
jgi:hypothetical protein